MVNGEARSCMENRPPLIFSLSLTPLEQQPLAIRTDVNHLMIDAAATWLEPLARDCDRCLQTQQHFQIVLMDAALVHLAKLLSAEAQQPPPSPQAIALAKVLCIHLLRNPNSPVP